MEKSKKVPGLITLKEIIEKTSSYTGQQFFKSLVSQIAEVLDVHGVWVTEYWPAENKLNALAFWLDGKHIDEYVYLVKNTPCEPVLASKDICHIPTNVIKLYPKDPDLEPLGAVSYMGLSLRDQDGQVLGHLALLDNKPMPEIPEVFALFKIFASRAAAELRREIDARKIIESEAKLNRIVNGTSDAIIEVDSTSTITQINQSAVDLFISQNNSLEGKSLTDIFDTQSAKTVLEIISKSNRDHTSLSRLEPLGRLTCIKSSGTSFPVTINLSSYSADGEIYQLIYLRDVSKQAIDEAKIQELSLETQLLKEKMTASQFEYILGESDAIKRCLEQVQQVGPTDANVLIVGETGTGKELFAKAIHDSSPRKSEKLVTLNCAALPSELIESELFGHVKGAFTGAESSRDGRFMIANKGSLFLDEIAELPLALQAKLLRVIQEGTFEKLGSSETLSVDVRIIAATHRDLAKMVQEGSFREDLFYRLNVFPLTVPPLRARGDDIKVLTDAFFRKLSNQRGLNIHGPTTSDYIRMSNYSWPGNVRELQNVVERGTITAQNGRFNLDISTRENPIVEDQDREVMTFSEIEHLEKQNIIKALNLTQWRISGENGAAKLLGIPRTTLTSKIQKLGIQRVAVAKDQDDLK